MKQEQLAINSISTSGDSLPQRLQAYREAGFRNVEFVLSHVKDYLAEGHSVADVRRLLDDQGLRCIGGFETGLVVFGSAEEQRANRELLSANARLLGELGATTMIIGTDGPATAASADSIMEAIAAACGELGARVADTGVNLCIEFNWSPVVKSLRTAVEISRRSGAPNVGVLFDPAHYHCTPSKFEQIDAASVPFIKHVHVDDMADIPGELSNCNSDRALPGQGCLDLPALFGAIEHHGYGGYFSIEMFSDELWQLPIGEASRLMYQSLLPLCSS